jgi:hypothetical protein
MQRNCTTGPSSFNAVQPVSQRTVSRFDEQRERGRASLRPMTAARKLAVTEPKPEHDPVWEAFLRAPVDPNPAPEHERLALADPSSRQFVDGATVTREIADRARAERTRRAR